MMKNKGFTLVELLAVIVILGLLTTIVITSISKILKDSRDDAYKLLSLEIQNAAKDYMDEHRDLLAAIKPSSPNKTLYLSDLIADRLMKSPVKNPKNSKFLNEDATTIVIHLENDGTLSYTVNLVDQ